MKNYYIICLVYTKSLFEKNLFSFSEEEKNAKSVLKYTYTLKKFKKWENARKK